MNEKEYIIMDRTESLIESICRDIVTFGFMLLCMYAGWGSKWWTFVTGCMFLLMILGRMPSTIKKRSRKFKSIKELKDYVATMEDSNPLPEQPLDYSKN